MYFAPSMTPHKKFSGAATDLKMYHNSGTENDTTMILVAKWSYAHVENFIYKILIWLPHNISLIYLCWVT